MGEYDGKARPLPWSVRNPVVFSRTTEEDGLHEPSSFVWPEDSDERVPILFTMSLNEYVVIASAVDAGSDIAYSEDALRVWWLWTRSLQEGMSMACCEDILAAIAELSAAQEANAQIVAGQLADLRNASAYQYRLYLESIYEPGNPQSIDANLSPDAHNWIDSHYDEAVLCSALMGFVYSWAQAKANEIRADISTTTSIAAAVAALAITGLEFFAIPITGLALTTGFISDTITKLMQIEALTDTTALDNIVCAMKDNMGAEAINAGTFALALTASTFDPGSNVAIVKALIESALGENYLVFLAFFGIAYQRFESDLEPVIACPNCGQFDPHVLHIVNHTANPYPGTITFVGSAGAEEQWDVLLAELPNTYWYMSIQDADGKAFTIVDAVLIVGTCNEWSIVTVDDGTVTLPNLEDAIGLDIYQPDLYCIPGAQAHILLTLKAIVPVWMPIYPFPENFGFISTNTETAVSVTSGFSDDMHRVWIARTDGMPFTVASITVSETLTVYQWFDPDFTEHLDPIEVGDLVQEIYYASDTLEFTLDMTIE